MSFSQVNKYKKLEADTCLRLSIFSLNKRHGIKDGIEGAINYIFKLEGIKKTILYSIYWHEGTLSS
jgi:hypothetical protein